MTAINLTVDIYGTRPSWVYRVSNDNFKTSIYRFYINRDLLTERTWIWNNNTYIQENVWIHPIINSQYTLTIQPIISNPAQIKFKLDNFNIVNSPFSYKQLDDLTISFTLG